MIKYAANATITKARAMYGNRLKDTDYKELTGKKSVAEAAEYLKKNTHFSEAFSTLNTASIHRGHLESVISKNAFDKYIELCSFQQLGNSKFYNYLIVLSEIKEILSVILHMNAESSEDYISTMPAYLISKASIDLFELAHSRGMKDLLQAIRHTPYYNALSQIQPDSTGKVDYLKCELLLRTYYFQWLTDVVKKDFRGQSRNVLINQIEMQVDFINLINAYRMKKYYGFSSDEIEKHSLPFYGKLNLKKSREMFNLKTDEEFISAFSKTFYGRKMSVENYGNFEFEINKQRSAAAKRSLMFSNNPAVSIFSFVYLMDVEVSNIITIIEGIRYGKKQDYILSRIVTT